VVPQTLVIVRDETRHVSIPVHTPSLYFTAGGFWQPDPTAKAVDGDAAQPAASEIPRFSVMSDRVHVVPS
jgi:hypothetical protein